MREMTKAIAYWGDRPRRRESFIVGPRKLEVRGCHESQDGTGHAHRASTAQVSARRRWKIDLQCSASGPSLFVLGTLFTGPSAITALREDAATRTLTLSARLGSTTASTAHGHTEIPPLAILPAQVPIPHV